MISDKPSAVPQGPISTAAASKDKGKKTVTTLETINSPSGVSRPSPWRQFISTLY